jgi:hypothetical protein
MENSEVNDYTETVDETVEGAVDESVDSLLGEDAQESEDFELEDEESDEDESDEDDSDEVTDFASVSNDFQEQIDTPQAPIVSMETLPITGEARVDDALGRLADLQGLPVHEHVDVFEDVQRRLHETLADLAGQ